MVHKRLFKLNLVRNLDKKVKILEHEIWLYVFCLTTSEQNRERKDR